MHSLEVIKRLNDKAAERELALRRNNQRLSNVRRVDWGYADSIITALELLKAHDSIPRAIAERIRELDHAIWNLVRRLEADNG